MNAIVKIDPVIELITAEDIKKKIDYQEQAAIENPNFFSLAPCREIMEYHKETRTMYHYKKFENGRIVTITSEREMAFLHGLLETMCQVKYYYRRSKEDRDMAIAYRKSYLNLKTYAEYEVRYLASNGLYSSKDELVKLYLRRITMHDKGLRLDAWDDTDYALKERYMV